MKIEIDFELYKILTNFLVDESDTYNNVIRRLIDGVLPESSAQTQNAMMPKSWPDFEGAMKVLEEISATEPNALARLTGGAWFDNQHFPEGTQFLARYKGENFQAKIKNGKWFGEDGVERNSPSAAASAICGNNVNGWKFWFVKRPKDAEWQKMDAIRQ